jgi:cytochrome b561
MNSNATSSATFAARCVKASRVIHWITVALVSGLLITALFGGIDPHGPGNTAFLWHSSLGISVYLLSISRVLLWLIYRPMAADAAGKGKGAYSALRIAFYALLIALPVSGWLLASAEGMPAHLFGMPALPQWYYRDALQQSTPVRESNSRGTSSNDKPIVTYLVRIHATLAAALSVVVVIHVFTVIRDPARRRNQRRGPSNTFRGRKPSAPHNSRSRARWF